MSGVRGRVVVALAAAFLAVAARADDGPAFAGRPASQWEEQLRSADWRARWLAARALGKIGPAFERTVADLVDALADGEPLVADKAAEALAGCGQAAAPGVARLIELAQKRPKERDRFLRALGVVGVADPDKAIGALAPVFPDEKQSEPAEEAIVALAAKAPAPAVAFLVEALGDKDWHVRWRAAIALRKVGAPAKAAIPALIRTLGTDDQLWVAREAASALGRIGEPTEAVIAALGRGLSHETDWIRDNCTDALVELGEPGFPALLAAADGRFPDTRARILGLLPAYPQFASESLPLYLEALRDPDARVRYDAILGLTGFEDVRDAALPALREAMKDPRPGIRAPAAAAVLRFAPDDADAMKALVDIARSPNKDVASRAAWAVIFLVTRHPAASVPFMRKSLSDPDAARRAGFAGLLDYASAGDPGLASSLVPLLADSNADVREVALKVLARCGDLDAAAVAKIRPLLADQETKVRVATVRALGAGGPAARAAAEDLRPLLKAPDATLRAATALALARLDPANASSLLPALVDALRVAPSPEIAAAIGALGPAASSSAEPLLDAMRGLEDERTCAACRAALDAVLPTR